MKPWRKVINTKRGPLSQTGKFTTINILECGHEFIAVGVSVQAAKSAERRRCSDCPPIVERQSSPRKRQSRAGNQSMPEF